MEAGNTNELSYTSLIKPTDSIEKAIQQLTKLNETYDKMAEDIIERAKKVEEAMNKINSATKKGQGSTRKAATDAEKLVKAQDKLNKSRDEAAKQLASLQAEQRKQNNVNKLTVKLNEAEEGSYDKLSAQYALNKIELNALGKVRREHTKEGKELQKQTADIYEEMKRLQEATGKYTLNVGNYSNSILDALKKQDRLNKEMKESRKRFNDLPKAIRTNTQAVDEHNKELREMQSEFDALSEQTGKSAADFEILGESESSITGLSDGLGELPGASGKAASGIQVVNRAFKALLANPIILVISLIVAGLAGLFKLFKKTKSGADTLAKGMGFLDGLMSQAVGATNKLRVALKDAFKDPEGLVKKLGQSIKETFTNVMEGAKKTLKSLGKALKALAKGEMEDFKDATKEASEGFKQFVTGMTPEQQKLFVGAMKDVTAAIVDQAQAFADLRIETIENVRANRELEKSVQDLTTEEELLKAKADDVTKSFREREEAAQKASELTVKRATLEKQIAKSNLDLINREVDLRRANGENIEELLDKQLEAYKTLSQAERDYLLTVRDNQKRESELKQDRLERDLDILIDGFDNQKTINERIIADESKTFAERRRLLEETQQLANESFNKQIATIQQFTGVQVKANELIGESDAVLLNEKIRSLGLSEIIEGRLLEIVRDRRLAIQDLAEAEKGLTDAKAEADKEAADNAKKARDAEYKAAKESIAAQYDLTLSEIDLLETTEAKKTKLKLEAERKRLEAVLALNQEFADKVSATQLQTLRNEIALIEKEISDLSAKKDIDIYSAVGLDLNDDKKDAIASSTQYAIDNITEILQASVEAADTAKMQADDRVQTAEEALQKELEARQKGFANDALTAQKELQLAKDTQAKAIEEQRKAQRQQATIDSLQQASSLISASAKIWSQLGFPFAIPAIGSMWLSFGAAKTRARQETQFADGGLEFLEGGSHASGKDISLGIGKNGVERKAEGGEAMAIINKKSTRKYKSLIPMVVDALNKGNFEDVLSIGGLGDSGDSADLSRLEKGVDGIYNQGRKKVYTDGRGRIIETYKNVRRTYVQDGD